MPLTRHTFLSQITANFLSAYFPLHSREMQIFCWQRKHCWWVQQDTVQGASRHFQCVEWIRFSRSIPSFSISRKLISVFVTYFADEALNSLSSFYRHSIQINVGVSSWTFSVNIDLQQLKTTVTDCVICRNRRAGQSLLLIVSSTKTQTYVYWIRRVSDGARVLRLWRKREEKSEKVNKFGKRLAPQSAISHNGAAESSENRSCLIRRR